MLRQIRWATWSVLSIIGCLTAGYYFGVVQKFQSGQIALPASATFGGKFTLTAHDGRTFDSTALDGHPYAIFFGFTHCPEVCPTTLLSMTNHLQALGNAADQLKVLFVTIDPERDSADYIKAYLSTFDPRIIGLTGSPEAIAGVAKAYRVFYVKVPSPSGDYTMNHTASVYLMDRKGQFAGTMTYEDAEADQFAKLKRLVAR